MSATASQLQELLDQQRWGAAKHLGISPSAQPLGISALDRALPDGGLPNGQVTELAITAGTGLATSLGLWACRAAQEQARQQGAETWCAFIDPSSSLFAPGVQEAGVDPDRLLVLRPPREERSSSATLNRLAIQLAEARLFSVIVVDIVGAVWGAEHTRTAPLAPSLTHWGKTVRRIAMAIEGTSTQVLLLTDRNARRTLPLPVALRLELQRRGDAQLRIGVAKDKRGRVSSPRWVSLEGEQSQPDMTDVARPIRGSQHAAQHLSLVSNIN